MHLEAVHLVHDAKTVDFLSVTRPMPPSRRKHNNYLITSRDFGRERYIETGRVGTENRDKNRINYGDDRSVLTVCDPVFGQQATCSSQRTPLSLSRAQFPITKYLRCSAQYQDILFGGWYGERCDFPR